MNKSKNNSTREQGQTIEVDLDESIQVSHSRNAKTFIPDPDELVKQPPLSVSDAKYLPEEGEYRGIRLEKLPVKGLKSFLYGFTGLIAVMLGWEIYSVFRSALETHWSLATGFMLLVTLVSIFGLRLVFSYLSDKENMAELLEIQLEAESLELAHDFGKAQTFIQKLRRFYKGKPQELPYQASIKQLADYSDDKEVIAHINHVFLAPLDKEAFRRVSNYSLQTGTVVAASPWASLDMALALWRSMKMIDEVAQVYGMRPSLPNRYKLLKQVVRYLALIGASEIAIDQVVQEFSASSLTGMTGARLGQGIGAGIYTARIGIAAMVASRPIAFETEQKPKLRDLVSQLVKRVKS